MIGSADQVGRAKRSLLLILSRNNLRLSSSVDLDGSLMPCNDMVCEWYQALTFCMGLNMISHVGQLKCECCHYSAVERFGMCILAHHAQSGQSAGVWLPELK
eukprot:8978733-Karenia_brevis.AAC.1